MKALGILLVVFGVIDILGDWFFEFDLWGDVIGITLPEIIWTYSGYIEVGVGWLILRAGAGEADTGEADTGEADTGEADTGEVGTGFKMMSGQLPQHEEDTDLDED